MLDPRKKTLVKEEEKSGGRFCIKFDQVEKEGIE
jgi:hypothetical protein